MPYGTFRRGLSVFAIALLIAGSADAKSHNKATQSHQEAKQDDRGTEKNPVFIKTVAPEKSEQSSAKEEQDRQRKEAMDQRLLDLTENLVWVGVLQWFIFFLQLIAFVVQACYLRRTVGEMKIGTKATIKAANAAKQSADIAEKSLNDLERPHIFIEDIRASVVSVDGNKKLVNLGGEIIYKLVNHGRTPAILIEICHKISITKNADDGTKIFPTPIDAAAEKGNGVSMGMAVGGGKDGLFSIAILDSANRAIIASINDGTKSLYMHGFVRYIDIFKKRRIIGYCSVMDSKDCAFALVGDERHCYARDEN
jgi:hypothetical protein